ncbi:MAG: hypothetical protein ABSD38_37760 [Syntrophorhabdales bacterium]|jgi:hypothetical protein
MPTSPEKPAQALSYTLASKWHAKADVVAAVLGPMGEAVVVHYGAWTCAIPSLRVPIWLPLPWGISRVLLKKIHLDGDGHLTTGS